MQVMQGNTYNVYVLHFWDNGCTEDNNTEIGSGDVEYIEEKETDAIHAAKIWMFFFV